MKKSRIIIIVVLALLGILFIVTTFYNGTKKEKLPDGVHGVVVKEVLQTSNYTYLHVEEEDSVFWIAVTSIEAQPGDKFYFSRSMMMTDFTSRELNRKFASIHFVDDLDKQIPAPKSQESQQMKAQKPKIEKMEGIVNETPAGGVTIAELFKNPPDYKDKVVTVRGVVLKYNPQIMHKNWFHVQDGTDFEGMYDLTITSLDSVAVGKTVTFTGKISVNKDFGSGYFYGLIMEEAKATDIR